LGAGAGLTVAAACAEPGVSAASVYRWKKLLAESPASEPQGAKPVIRTAGATRSPGATLPFLAVQVRSDDRPVSPARPSDAIDTSRTALRIVLPNGVVIHVARDLDSERLGDVVIGGSAVQTSPSSSTAARSVIGSYQ